MVERYIAMASISLSSELCLFRGIVHTKTGERLRASGSLSYTRMRELFLAKLVLMPSNLGCMASELVVHQPQQMPGYPIACSSATAADGARRQQRMVTSKTLLLICCQFQRA